MDLCYLPEWTARQTLKEERALDPFLGSNEVLKQRGAGRASEHALYSLCEPLDMSVVMVSLQFIRHKVVVEAFYKDKP